MSFEADLSRSFGGNANEPVMTWLTAWAGSEGGSRGGSHGWNPLNVAGDPGFPFWVSTGPDGSHANIAIYPDEATAVARTHARIASGYPGITAILRDSEVDASHISAALPDLCKWGSKIFAGALANNSDYCKSGVVKGGKGAGGASAVEGAGAADWTSFDLGDAWNAITEPLQLLKEAFRFVLWLFQPKHWVQMLEVLVGSVLVGLGLWQLAKSAQGASGGSAGQSTRQAVAPVRRVVTRGIT